MNKMLTLRSLKDASTWTRSADLEKSLSMRAVKESHQNLDDTLAKLGCSLEGLTDQDAAARLAADGPNEVAHEKPPHWAIQLLMCFKNPFIVVLVILALIQFATMPDDLRPIIIIGVMVAIAVTLQFWQEYRSALAAEKLTALVRTTATVLRREDADQPSQAREIPIQELVAGDLVRLSAGDMIPADVRLIASRDLFVSQAALTGEALPVEKYDTLGAVVEKSAMGGQAQDGGGFLDLANVCFLGTNVVSGTATAIVVATGPRTYFGSLAKSIVGQRAQTAFDRGVNSVSWVLIRFMLIMVPVVLLINGFTKGDWLEAFLFAVSVAVGLTPEMLPLLVTANLARGAMAMSRRKVIVKRLNAIQNFGAMDVLCTDKTGTLTQDRVILERHLDVLGHTDERVLQLGWLNSHHQTGIKNLLDAAVLRYADELARLEGFNRPIHYKKVDEIPFDFVRRRLSVVVEGIHGEHLLVCKGAVEEMLSISTTAIENRVSVTLDDTKRSEIMARARALNEDGFRVILVATREIAPGETRRTYRTDDEAGLVVRGYLAFLDPPKETAKPALAALLEHGVTVKILTGDNAVVTSRICDEVGLRVGSPILGRDLDKLDDETVRWVVESTTVFAKMSPLHKARVVNALKANGHKIGYLGDGINDAPALRDADVGISVDTAADIAKESADIILLEKSLMVLKQGVIKGRETFGNIIKYIKMTASSNFGNVFSVLIASAVLPFLPMLPVQLLIQNLLYDFSQLSIPWDNVDREYLATPRKWQADDIARFMLFIGPISSVFDIVTYLVMWHVFDANSIESQSLFQSGWFVEGLLSQTLIVHMIRTEKIPFFQSTASPPVVFLTTTIMAVGIAIPFSSLGAAVGLQPLPIAYFPWLAGILVAYCVLIQAVKTVYRRRFGLWL